MVWIGQTHGFNVGSACAYLANRFPVINNFLIPTNYTLAHTFLEFIVVKSFALGLINTILFITYFKNDTQM